MSTMSRNRRSSLGAAATLFAVAGLPLMVGCETDSFLNPSVTGRWENTPTVVPILERLSVVEDRAGEFVEYSEPTQEDLLPGLEPYRLGPGDAVEITLWDDIQRNQPNNYQRSVDSRGFVDLPQLGQIYLNGLTIEQTRETLSQALGKLVADPIVDVNIVSARNMTFTIIGAVETPGPYLVPRADYPLLEALSAAGRYSEGSTDYVYIVRQVPLSDKVTNHGIKAPPAPGTEGEAPKPSTPSQPQTPPPSGDNLINLIDKLSQPAEGSGPAGQAPAGQPAPQPLTPPADGPATPPAEPKPAEPAPTAPPADNPPIDLPDSPAKPATPKAQDGQTSFSVLGTGSTGGSMRPRGVRYEDPPVDLPDSKPTGSTPSGQPSGGNNWVFLDGKWVQISRPAMAAAAGSGQSEQLLTQRVIRVSVKSLVSGDAKSNIIIRPGDVLRIPPVVEGVVYIDGQIQRPGVYNLPAAGRLTLSQVITAAGGFGEQAIPERTDLVRRLSDNRQAIIRVDLRAINEGTQPDIYLKPDDRVNVGTNFWAYPLAVIRNGFRASYGFGFLIDRNFGNDIFGAPPTNTVGQ
jgi:polysaccharide export outer membrane protein